MITLSYTEGHYCIRHAPQTASRASACFIAHDFLPKNAERLLDSLLIFGPAKDHIYTLTDHQNREASRIFYKIDHENTADYVFSEQLEKTYLLELVHFVTKLHYQAEPKFQ
jgi:hypothetical protein